MDLREVADFLRIRRRRLQPAEMGLKPLGRRRTPGLRRDEVADLAGISTVYYTQLEQARGRRPSREVLERIARALGLGHHDRAILFELAGIATSYPERPIDVPSSAVVHLLERLPDAAVLVQDARRDVIACNRLATLLGDYVVQEPVRQNLALRFFLPHPDDPPRVVLINDEHYGPYLVASLRRAATRYPKDPGTRRVVQALMHSPAFRALWDANGAGIAPVRHQVKLLEHPRVGRLELDCTSLYVPEDDQEVVMMTAQPGSVSAEKLRRLGEEGVARPSAPSAPETSLASEGRRQMLRPRGVL